MDRTRRHIWQIAALMFLAIIVVIVLFKANAPTRTRVANLRQPIYSDGNIASGEIRVPTGAIIKFKFELSRRSQLRGSFATKGLPDQVTCIVLDESNFEKMMKGEVFKAEANTGSVPGGKIDRKLEQGSYYLVFDNRSGPNDVVIRTAEFKVE